MFKFLTKKPKKETTFSHFFREASSGERKKVFQNVIKKATEDQRKTLSNINLTKTA
mgnify:CR=1 FL=1